MRAPPLLAEGGESYRSLLQERPRQFEYAGNVDGVVMTSGLIGIAQKEPRALRARGST
jgi:hypothetical protein